ncbi:Hypothetical predicted protein [Cloeon dipterum]|uniref:Uncharacterized protein n=1 Tax=Cloeon dipterum TaxID=197152 RepID=A0A8S1DWY9_9INSE|nr:Hypothetical predicted protein [Cloeon dipterum]
MRISVPSSNSIPDGRGQRRSPPAAQLGQERANNGCSEARCLSLPSHRPANHMHAESVAKDKKDAACTKLASASAAAAAGETKVCSSSSSAAPISAFGMTLLAAALLVHFLLLTSVARNGDEMLAKDLKRKMQRNFLLAGGMNGKESLSFETKPVGRNSM